MKSVLLTFCSVGLTMLALTGTHSQAALLAYDGFDYAEGPLSGNGSASDAGFAGAWSQGANSGNVISTGLTFGTLQVSGGAVDFSNGDGSSSTLTTTNFRTLDAAYNDPTDTSTGELWWSFLIQPGAYTGTPFAGLSFYTDAAGTNADLGTNTRNSSGSLVYGFSDLDITNNFLLTDVDVVDGETVLVVARVILGGGSNTSAHNEDRIHLYINPAIGGGTPAISDANANVTADFQTIRFASANGQPFVMDEFRFGETFADVTPSTIPEPSSLVLLTGVGLGLVGGYRIARRRGAQS
ncbi:PEP-CTERM sorting domain-containing protein [Aeoliella sp. SH292]|uniref:PEP-CTERM sorting domain-containing protein n=1 Tax=Aeoliella sp. SH292 TaxID=3454464 RepID=UPI003F9E4D01